MHSHAIEKRRYIKRDEGKRNEGKEREKPKNINDQKILLIHIFIRTFMLYDCKPHISITFVYLL